MATPKLYANTPTSGSIAWDAFTIQYNGIGYAIPAGNTAERWVWWKYNGGGVNTYLDSDAEVPQDLTADDLVLFGNKRGAPVNIQTASLIDGDLLVDGSILTKSLDAECVTADVVKSKSLIGDLFAAQLVLSTTFSTGTVSEDGQSIVGARCEMGPDGFYTIDADNNPIAKFPLTEDDEAYVRANFKLLSAEVDDNFTMRGTNNTLATESELTLDAGVSSPSSPPTVEMIWDTVQLDTTTATGPATGSNSDLGTFSFDPSSVTSMCWDADWSCWVVIQAKLGGFRIWRFDSTGALFRIGGGDVWCEDYAANGNASVAHVPGVGITTLFQNNGTGWWYLYGPSYANKIPSGWVLDVLDKGRFPQLGYDKVGGHFMIAQSNGGSGGTFHVRRVDFAHVTDYSQNAVSISTYEASAGSGVGRRVNGIVYGQQVKTGQNRYVRSVDDFLTNYVFDTSGTRKWTDGADEEWLKSTPALAFCHDGSKFVSLDSTGTLTFYTDWTWPETSNTTYIGASAYDSEVSGGYHETPVGSFANFSQRKRAKLKITMPETNDSGKIDDPDKWKLYYARKSSTPLKADLKYIDMIGSPTEQTNKIVTAEPTGGNPPGGVKGAADAVNNFPGGTPASIESAAFDAVGPLISVLGNGAARLGPWQIGTDGKTARNYGPERPGTIFMWPGLSIPLDVAVCEGQAVPRPKTAGAGGAVGNAASSSDVYRRVWEEFGTAFGAGDGSTTFNLPDLRRRFPIGVNSSWPLGSNDGIINDLNRTPYHDHDININESGPPTNAPVNTYNTGSSGSNTVPRAGAYDGHKHPVTGSTGKTLGLGGGSYQMPNLAVYFVMKL